MTEQQRQNLLLKVTPLSTIRNNKFITQGEKFSGNRDSEGKSFCIEYGYIGGLHVFNKNLKVYLYM